MLCECCGRTPGTYAGCPRYGHVVKAIAAIHARYAELEDIHENYLAYQRRRVAERDHHGAWDVAINLAETEAEMAGLQFALKALGDG